MDLLARMEDINGITGSSPLQLLTHSGRRVQVSHEGEKLPTLKRKNQTRKELSSRYLLVTLQGHSSIRKDSISEEQKSSFSLESAKWNNPSKLVVSRR
jgi:hypothetical protein